MAEKQEWTVTRQYPYYYNSGSEEKSYVVEIAMGGIDYSGSDALSKKYDGEFRTFNSLVEAVETAIRIRDQWRKDSPNLNIEIGTGATGGGMFEIEPTDMDDDELRTWAQERDDKYGTGEEEDESGEWWDEGEWEEEEAE